MPAKSKIEIHLIDKLSPHEFGHILVGCGSRLLEAQCSELQTYLQRWREKHYPQVVMVTVGHDYGRQEAVASIETSSDLSDEERENFVLRYSQEFWKDIRNFLQQRH